MDVLNTPLQYIKGVGPKRAEALSRLGIETVYDLLWHLPREYQDRNQVIPIANARSGEVLIHGELTEIHENRTRRGVVLVKGRLRDQSGSLGLVWFNQGYLARILKPGMVLLVRGRVNYGPSGMEVSVYEHEVVKGTLSRGLVPVYPLVEGVSQRMVREAIGSLINNEQWDYPEAPLPPEAGAWRDLAISDALRMIHGPATLAQAETARQRLAFEEFLLLQLALLQDKQARSDERPGISHQDINGCLTKVLEKLPFELTAAQRRVLRVIENDMRSSRQMNRLLQGDVGSGKTVVAALASALAIGGGYQVALMAPTEILAQQHAESLKRFLEPAGIEVALLTGGVGQRERRATLTAIREGRINLVAGTHALIQEGVEFADLGLAIIDEQHRFGVRQRSRLAAKGGHPDVLVMTATPIPRTLALTVYGDLDVSVLDELPPGRKPVKTYYVPFSKLERVYDLIGTEVQKGRQVYVVCPLVEESEKQDLQDATSLREQLAREIFPDYRVGLMHGKMDSREKDEVMQAMVWGEIDILVTTTVVEVGVDIPNASVMVIMHAERFGLSQLHQLRGRVGRGSNHSFCLLVADPASEEARQRLSIMEKSEDGFEIANQDLKIRGPGEFWGTRQHGLPEFKAADLIRDGELLEQAREVARHILEIDPDLTREQNAGWGKLIKKLKKLDDIANN